ncbi:hypothetical protein QJS66_11935 [Kocuria rhizophila]|nr:hypothetical protein QJS66_11935 [Kocuria rhizophila]
MVQYFAESLEARDHPAAAGCGSRSRCTRPSILLRGRLPGACPSPWTGRATRRRSPTVR